MGDEEAAMFMQVQRLRAVLGTMWRCGGRVLTAVLIVAGLIASLAGVGGIQGIHHVKRTDSSVTDRDREGGQQRKHPPVSPDEPDLRVVIVGFDEGEDKPVITVRWRRRRPGSGSCPGGTR
jgi:hypothetical protein